MRSRVNTSVQRGFTFIEILIVIAILGILSAVVLAGLMNVRSEQELDYATKEVRQMFELARSHTLASRNDTSWGVAVETDHVVLFEGTAYDPTDSNNVIFELPKALETANADFGGSVEVYFELGTGSASAAGSLEVQREDSPAESRTITVSETGIINLQQ